MALYALSDLHLSFGADKPMHIFRGWADYETRILRNWTRLVTVDDAVVLPGDLSWALKLEDTLEDLRFLHALPGQKFILKGNHDLWWSSRKKMETFLAQHDLTSIRIVHNNAYAAAGFAVCGTRGWAPDATGEADRKIIAREAGRLAASLQEANALGLPPAVFLHYPPAGDTVCEPLFEVLTNFGVTDLYHGHVHGAGLHPPQQEIRGVRLHLVSCDCVDFTPVRVKTPAKNVNVPKNEKRLEI